MYSIKKEEVIAPGVWYIYDGDTKAAITNKNFAEKFMDIVEGFSNSNPWMATGNQLVCIHCGKSHDIRYNPPEIRHEPDCIYMSVQGEE